MLQVSICSRRCADRNYVISVSRVCRFAGNLANQIAAESVLAQATRAVRQDEICRVWRLVTFSKENFYLFYSYVQVPP